MNSSFKKKHRVYIRIGRELYYANCSTNPPYIRWSKSSEEYPDVFSFAEASAIRDRYQDQMPRIEDVYVNMEEEVE